MRKRLVESILERLETEVAVQNPVIFLKKLDIEEVIDISIATVYLYTRETKGNVAKFAEVITAIGHAIRNKNKLPKNSALAAKAGAFILYSFEANMLLRIKMGGGKNGHGLYLVDVIEDEILCELWNGLTNNRSEKLPALSPYAPWETCFHPTGTRLIKTNDERPLKITAKTHPIVFDCVNKAQEVGWRVNERVFSIYAWALRNKTTAFEEIWEMQSAEAKRSKLREVHTIGDMASRFVGKVFYHLYTYDFRGRKYPATAYLHEQGSDLAKGLLLRAASKPIGKQGFDWLLVSIASNWAGDAGRPDGYKTDKIPIADRIFWSLDNEDILLSYAESPKVNQGWMKADKPWQFIAACMELANFRRWQKTTRMIKKGAYDEYGYASSLECYIDGSNNGSQHLSALTRDEITAPHVNLVPLALPGDLYKYVADHVWRKIAQDVSKLAPGEYQGLSALIDTLTDMKKQLQQAELKSERRMSLAEGLKLFKLKESDEITKAAVVFWNRVKDSKHRRKVVKR